MIGSDYVLEAHNIYHTAEVDNGGCLNVEENSALVLKGVSLTLHSGEVMAILGSKGSGKKALLDVIACRAEKTTRGQVLLNGSTLTKSIFQQKCGYVTHSVDFIHGLTVSQTLHYTPTVFNGYSKGSKVRQILADLALSQVANKRVEYLNMSERRRLSIGMQLVRESVMVLLDEPTYGLDPLDAYLLVSILSNYAKKTGCGILLSMEKPRSDVFPFLDRALFLCLGGVVYSGSTRGMLEYFHSIGFPCPQLENPLMYYLCLSTVDRRSRDRFIESSQQIEALVQRFARETPLPDVPINPMGSGKVPLSYGKPGELKVLGMLYLKLLAVTFSCSHAGLKALFLRLFALPAAVSLMWIFYTNMKDDGRGFFTREGMILNLLGLAYGTGVWTTISLFPPWRTQFIEEYDEGLYSGTSLIMAYESVSIPFSIISSAISACIIYPLILDPNDPDGTAFTYLLVAFWSSYIVAEQLCITLHLFARSRINVAIIASYIFCVCIALASGTVRSYQGLQPWLKNGTSALHTKYASNLFHGAVFSRRSFLCIPNERDNTVCPEWKDYLFERIGRERLKDHGQEDISMVAAIIFAVGFIIFNLFLYLIPVPTFIRRKFRN